MPGCRQWTADNSPSCSRPSCVARPIGHSRCAPHRSPSPGRPTTPSAANTLRAGRMTSTAARRGTAFHLGSFGLFCSSERMIHHALSTDTVASRQTCPDDAPATLEAADPLASGQGDGLLGPPQSVYVAQRCSVQSPRFASLHGNGDLMVGVHSACVHPFC